MSRKPGKPGSRRQKSELLACLEIGKDKQMNIAVIGATGMVGERTVAEAVARGHQVDAYSRSGNAVPGAEGKPLI